MRHSIGEHEIAKAIWLVCSSLPGPFDQYAKVFFSKAAPVAADGLAFEVDLSSVVNTFPSDLQHETLYWI